MLRNFKRQSTKPTLFRLIPRLKLTALLRKIMIVPQ